MDNPFATSFGGSKITDFEGRLLLVSPTAVEENVPTEYGPTTVVDADVVVLDGPDAPERIDNIRIFQSALVRDCRRRKDTDRPMLLARLGTVPNKRGDRPVWVFKDPSPEDINTGTAYWQGRQKKAAENDNPFA
jgi:hypothetical protein